MEIGFITMEKMDNRERNSVGSSRIRGRWIWETWNKLYPKDICEQFVIGRRYDVLVFQKVYWEDMLEKFDGLKVIDLCDPDWLEGRDVMRYVNACDICTTSGENLKEFIQKFTTTPVHCIPDRIKLDEHIPREPHKGKARKICWMGYSHNQHYIYPCLEFLAEKGLELTVISNQQYAPPKGFSFVKIVNYPYTYPQVHDRIKECDLYLVPETDDAKGHFKTNNKALTAMALGVPVVRVPDDLNRLMDEDVRNKQMEEDLKEIKENWLVEKSVNELRNLIDDTNKTGR